MEPLSSEARARLAAFRSAESPDRAVADRVLAALEQRVDEGGGDDLDEEAPRRSRLAPRVLGGFALAAGVLLALTWAVMQRGEAPQTHVAAPYQAREGDAAQTAEAVRRPEPARAPAPEPAPEVAPPEPSADKPVAPDPAKTRRPAREDTVAAEVDLLRRAKLAAPAERLQLLEEHARRFPGGILAAERSLLEIEARCALGQRDAARDLAANFPRRFPGSPLVDRAATLCTGPAAQP
ncbi:hypothetical protein SAMN02745121_06963 [Nannocystis exedens]|uniref:Uncharacterized protein n=1 Tax=Nannocystis exedens TaxID=54 RepID=A0A1I2FZ96_9BACT|nr:hypothetical protein [Nannocystis exedens]PCC74597.1 hypothetical protein NAEX_07694 [Nannocystis exedens]SFF10724.1 hypothetical protein SAMN02745121_06963 [Nannocystis exedens]